MLWFKSSEIFLLLVLSHNCWSILNPKLTLNSNAFINAKASHLKLPCPFILFKSLIILLYQLSTSHDNPKLTIRDLSVKLIRSDEWQFRRKDGKIKISVVSQQNSIRIIKFCYPFHIARIWKWHEKGYLRMEKTIPLWVDVS